MSAFRAVNMALEVPDQPRSRPAGEITPTTPRPNSAFFPSEQARSDDIAVEEQAARTPTRDSFGGFPAHRFGAASAFSTQGSNANGDVGADAQRDGGSRNKGKAVASADCEHGLSRGNSRRSAGSSNGSRDVNMDDVDDDEAGQEGEEGANSGDSQGPPKKKKGQRFFCKDFPPCHLSFTRSEHLARHIRKHTGERPFQCHCSRRFSRLDNLRQHAQTVHVNEDIPGDSLAATGTRFQRQIRTDRVRPPAGRSRASTLGSNGGYHRGHGRNLSASSIASSASNVSQQDEGRRRPPPLAIASDYNPRLASPGGQHLHDTESPSGYSTPTSSVFSPGIDSPMYPSGLHSPTSGPRPSAFWGDRAPARRLSVPSGGNPFQSPPQTSAGFAPPYASPLQSSTASTFSGSSSFYASPTSSVFSDARRDSLTAAEAEWRRRTWHPGTSSNLAQRPATSGLSYYQTADAPEPAYSANPAASQAMRLPGIESFDHAPPQPTFGRRREPSPMQVDQVHRPPVFAGLLDQSASGPDDRRNHPSWDMSLHKGITKLEIASSSTASASGPAPREPSRHHHSYSLGALPSSSSSRPLQAPHSRHFVPSAFNAPSQPPHPSSHAESSSATAEPPVTPRKNKRHGWYNGPLSVSQQARSQPAFPSLRTGQRTSPEDSSSSEGVPTPSASTMGEYHPAIRHSNGFIEPQSQGVGVDDLQKVGPPQGPVNGYSVHPPHHELPNGSAGDMFAHPHARQMPSGANDMRRLEALVAVATREDRAAGANAV